MPQESAKRTDEQLPLGIKPHSIKPTNASICSDMVGGETRNHWP